MPLLIKLLAILWNRPSRGAEHPLPTTPAFYKLVPRLRAPTALERLLPRAAHHLVLLLLASLPGHAFAAVTGTWTTASPYSASAAGVTVSMSPDTAFTAAAAGAFTTSTFWTNPYSGTVSGATAINFTIAPTTTQTLTFTFSKPVTNPVLHIMNMGGSNGTTNSSSWLLSASNLGTLPTLSRLSGNVQFQVLTSNTIQRAPGATYTTTGCSVNSQTDSNDDGSNACGSVEVVGTGITSLSFTVTFVGGQGVGDAVEMIWSVAGANIAVAKQSLGGTGTFSFSETNSTGTPSLNTATSNPTTSSSTAVTDNSQPIVVTEAATAGYAISGTSCVDQNATAVASSLAGNALTIAAAAYQANQNITCTFTNSKIPTVAVQKITTGAVGGSFAFSQTNLASAPAAITTTTIGTAAPASPTPINVTTIGTAVTLTENVVSGFGITAASCTDTNSAVTGNTGSIGTLAGNTLTIPAANVNAGAAYTCVFTNHLLVPVLAVTKSAPSPALTVNTNSTYTLTVSNSGAGVATSAQVKDQLPANLTFVSATGTNWTCSNSSGLITCNFAGGTIAAAGGTSTITVTVNPAVAAAGTSVTNYASIDPSGGSSPPNPGAGCSPAASCASAGPNTVIYINPVADRGSAVSGTGATVVANVASNDTVNGAGATLGTGGNATIAQSGTWPTGIALNTSTGAITTTAAVQPGTYSVVYQLCDRNTPANCATATDTITVTASILPVAESGTAVSGTASTPIANVAGNDTVNGAGATLGTGGNATVAQSGTWPTGIALDTTSGAISTTTAVQPGTYSVVYQLCDRNTPANCATATDTVTVTASIVPNADSGIASAGTASSPIANVASNDTVNGAAATLGTGGNATVAQSGTWPTGIALNTTTGAITTTTAVQPGTYSVVYQLCDRNTPVNCATTTDTVTVSASIIPVADAGNASSGTASTPIANVAANDTVNGAPATLGTGGNATVSQSGTWPTGIALNTTTGAISTTTALQPGTYSVTYQLCDKNTPANCATVTDTLTIAAAIVPVADSGGAVSGTASTPVSNVAANDSVNGVAATLGTGGNATVAQSGTWPTGIALNTTTGAITTTTAVQPGTYSVTYQLCDKNAPANCATVADTITVSANIHPVADTGTAVSGAASTPIANVAANDTVNGAGATLGSGGNATVAQSGTWPTGIALNTTSGAITTTTAVQPGTYSVTYQLCDKSTPANCATVADTVTVSANIQPVADTGTAVSGTASTPITNVAANDTVNGVAATLGTGGNATVAQSGTWPTGVALNTTTGAITTTAAVPPGTYSVTYQLCDKNTPANCATVTDTVTVSASIIPVTDTGSAVSGTASTPITNVAANDTVNGVAATLGTGGNATAAQSGTWPSGIALNTTTGAISTSAAVQPGTYSVSYQLCDKNTPANCATVADTVTVTANIQAVADTGTAVSGTASTPITNVAANDTVNGAAATLGTGGNATVAQSGTWPTGIALNTTSGAISTTAAVQPGTYSVTYQLCDKNTPANCATVADTITVTASIHPVADSGTAVSGTASTPIANVASNDTVNGAAATLGTGGNATVAQSGTWPTGIALNTTTGAITTTTAVQPGTYSVTYQLCDKNTPANCATVADTVTVTASIVPVADTGSVVSGAASTPIANVAANDSVNGVAATLGTGGNATVAQSGTWPTGIALNTTTGAITTTAAVQPGTYSVTYQLCDKNTPANCATVADTVTVTASIVPVADTGSVVSGAASTPIANVAANDSVNGVGATLGIGGNATVAQSGTWPSGITLNTTTGAISTSAAVQPGTYSVSYQLCDKNTPANCATVADTVTVTANIQAVADTGTAVSGTASTPITNVAANDIVNGAAATLGTGGNATVAQSGTWPTGIALNTTTGAITTTAAVQPGTYSVTYQLCDKNTPANCATANDTVTVTASIHPVADSGTAASGTASTPIANVAANDTVNGAGASLGTGGNATVAQSGTWPTGITLNTTTGAVTTTAAVQPGTYSVTYQLCDKNTPANCATVADTVTVTASIVPVADTGSVVSGAASTPIANVAANDTVNGAAATLGTGGNATVAQSGTWPTGIALNTTTGAITTSAAVQPGTYSVTYQLCDKNTPANCASIADTVTVTANIQPVADTGTAVSGTGSTPITNVAANDTVNGVAATLGTGGNATVAQSGTWPTGIALNTTTGAITVTVAVQPGTYSVTYQLCDKNTPANCATVADTITVTANIHPVADSGTAVSGTAATPIANVAANDTVNGAAATLGTGGNATVAQSGTWPTGVALNTTTGAITTTTAVQPGTYSVTYQLCDKATPANCATVADTVTVTASIVPVADTGSAAAGTAATPIANVTTNDTVNGVAATLGTGGNATVAQSGTWPTGIALNTTTGAVTTTATVQPGTYSITYQLCDKNTPANCATVADTVTVTAAIIPVADAGTAVSGTASTVIANVAANDTVNGVPATLGTGGNATVAQSGTWPTGIALNTTTGAITTTTAVQPGTYTVTYQLCDKNTPANCATVADTITVTAAIVPVADTGSAVSGTASTAVANVAANDTVNGTAATLGTGGNATVTESGTWPSGVILNTTTGAITTSAAVQPGTYSVIYQLCDKNTPANCATMTDTVTVTANIHPVAESGSAVSGTASTAIANVAANDTVNGTAATLGTGGNATVAQSGTWPTGIALNTTTGAVTTSTAVQPGTYSVTYQLCDKNTPTNCATVADTVTITALIIPVADSGSAVSGTASTPIANVAANDTVNGAAATLGTGGNATVAQSGTWPTGIALNTSTGAITTTTAVQPGTYSVTYQLCDTSTPANCATVSDTVTITASIVPVTDSGTAVSGSASTPIANVAANDTVNGSAATLGTSGNATVAQSGTWPTGIGLNTTTGAITTSAAVQPGTYSVTYQLCDKNTPVHCATVADTITVSAAIVPIADTGTAVSGAASTAVANVAANDTVNGAAATLGTSGNATVAQSGTWPSGIALNTTTGAITTSVAVQPGTYSVTYQLCDKNTPANCATVADTVTVTANIHPVADTGTAVAGTASTPIANVAANDTVNGVAATLGTGGNATVAQSGTWATGIALNTTTGAITTTAAVQPGTYSVTYQLCDKNTPANCATVADTVTVTASIVPVADTGSVVSGTASTPIANVAANDTVNGVAATLGTGGNATVAQSGTWATGIALNTTTGAITTTAAVQPGIYSVTYQLCDKNTPANCATVADTVTVTASIVPVADTGSAVSGTASTPIANVAANDTVNGVAATLGTGGNATVAQSGTWPTGIVLNTTTGAITTSAAVQPGTYSVTYQLCDRNTPANCATVADTITMTANIQPVTDTGSAVSGTASTPIANVAANDTVNGAAATLGTSGNATVAQSGTWPTGIALNTTTGAVTTTAAVQPGTYSAIYQLCDKNTPVNCATVADTVNVTANVHPVADTGTAVAGTASTPIANVAANDTVNGVAATLGTGGNSTVAQSGTWPTGIALNTTTGAITTTVAVQPGTYSVTYQLCDDNTPTNCATAADTVTVSANIHPVTDSGTVVSGAASTPIANVAANDTVNGVAATLGTGGNATIAQSGTWPTGVALNTTTGAITTTAAVQPGTYSVIYQLCDKNTPANCATVTDTVTVTASIIPVADSGTAISGAASTPIANVVANDTVNGAAATLGTGGNATVAQSGTWPTGIALNTSTGAITTTAAVQPGTYSITYQLCDKNTPVNCATVADNITVTASIVPVADTGTALSGIASTPVVNVAANDTVNGAVATLGASGNATVSQSGSWPAGIALNTTTGAITTTAAVQPGSYSVTYQLCDKSTPANCATVTDTITVTANIHPVAETGTAVSGTASTPIANVAANDTVNGVAATLGATGNATVAQSGTWPTGIALNPTTGAITTTATVQPGSYPVTYQLCDRNTPANCATVIDTLNVSAAIVPVADTGTVVSGTASTAIANVSANDTVNGTAAVLGTGGNATVAQSGTWATGIALNTTTGAITTTAAVQPGIYSVTYQLCDKNTPANCATVADTVTVTASIHPVADTGTTVSGTASTAVVNVAANDIVNGVAATLGTGGNATVAQSGTWPSGIALNTTTGAITTTAAVQPGTYSVTYQLCDKNTPANCATVADTLTVTAAINAVTDTGSAVSGTASTPIANVASNDTVNGAAATLGTGGNATVAQSGTWPSGIALNTTGAITTTTAVQPGTYSVTYQLCDKNTPANCATVNDTVTVTANIHPVVDTGTAVSGATSTPIANVAANDSVNGVAATLGVSGNATVAPSGTWPTGIALNTSTGAVTTTAVVQPGTYSITYQLCDKSTPANCATVADTVTVTAAIVPVADTGTAVSGTAATPIANVAANDTVNGVAAILGTGGNATVAQSGTWPTGIALNTTTGAITSTAAVQPGTYSVTYQLCDRNTPANCATAADTVTIGAAIIPVADTGTAVSGTASTAIANVASNDTVNGAAAVLGTGGNATVAQSGTWPSGIALNTTSGAITASAAVQPGTYSVTYQLCDRSTPANCATMADTVSVTANIHPVTDAGTAVSGTASTPVANVAANDTVNGVAATLGTGGNATVAQSGSWPTGIALNTTTGAVTTTSAVQPGTYSLTYQLCDKNTPANCATVADTITVSANIHPVTETGTTTAGTASTAISNVAANDTVNGATATLGTGGNATVAQSGTWATGITLNTATGAITTTAAVQPGTYSVAYQLCDTNTPADCATVTDTVNVYGNIRPIADTGSAVSGTASTPIASVVANDTVNGVAATLGTGGNATVAQSGSWPAGITLNTSTGAVSTTAAVQPGTYSVLYQLCDRSTPANCATVADTITVGASIIAVADTGTAVSGTASTPIANVASNDTVNGAAATLGTSGNATVTTSGTWPAGIALNTTTGAITTTAAVQPGVYAITYQLCDKNTPANCATVADTITVSANVHPVADTGSAVSGTASTPVANVAANDTVNGVAATLGTSGNATVATSGTWPTGIVLNTTTGAITTTAAVQPGTYSVTYQLCDKNTPANCATVADTINVSASIHPVADTGSVVSGAASTPIANVAANDTVNGVAATLGTGGNATVAQSGTWPTGIALNTSTGAITTTAAVQPGSYAVVYQLCDTNTPANCATVTDTVTVTGNIHPVTDAGTAVSGTASAPIANVAANDTVNGAAATLGTGGNATVAQSGTWATGITLNTTTGAVSTTAAVQPGTYSLTYQLCDRSTPANCATVVDTIVVTAVIVPVADSGTAVSGTASTPIANVASNDTVNGAVAILGTSGNATVATSGTWPTGLALNTTTGAVTTTAALQPGVYSITYQLCDKNTPANCATVTDSVNVSGSIHPVADTGTAISGTASNPIANVAANDTVNGAAATLGATGNATVAQSGTWPAGIALNTTSGAISTTAAVQPGTYSVTYQLCDKSTSPNCATVTDTITVTANIHPVADSGSVVSGVASIAIANVTANDTVNGAAVTLGTGGNATVAQSGTWPAGIALNTSTGAVSTTAAVQPGTYSVTYQLCDINTPANCATVVDTVSVTGSIHPVTDVGSAVSGTASTAIANVAANDTVNGVAATLGTGGNATVTQSGTWPTGIALNTTTGAITTTAAVQPGSYSVTYQLCDRSTPANCATVADTVTVAANINAVADSGSTVSGTASTAIANVAANDTVNGAAGTLGTSGNATVATSGTWPAGIALNTTTGAITTTAAVQPGTYSVTYQLCDKNTPANCATAADTVTVSGNIHPVIDTGTAVSGTASTPITNVASNDTVNGAAATLGTGGNATVVQSGTWPSGMALNTTSGAITTTAAVQPGSYTVIYQLCDRSTPANCATATDTVTVSASIHPVTDSGSAVAGIASVAIANVTANDTVNGVAASLGTGGNATVAQSGSWPAGIALNTSTGAVSTTAAVLPGTYSVTYQLCDTNTPANCATVADSVTVTGNIRPVADTGSAVAGTPSSPIANVAANDSVDGAAATLGSGGNATVAQSGTWPTGIALNTTTGTITTTAAVQPGTYTVTYQLCDRSTPANCATAADTITVTANIHPVADSGSAVSGTASTAITNVAANDTVNGAAATLGASGNATVSVSGTWPTGVALNTTTGAITTTAAVQPGTYTVTYQLCDKNTPANCATVADTITLTANIHAISDTGTAVSGTAATPIANVASNDTVNGAVATLGTGGNATVTPSGTWPTGITLNTATGAITTTSAVLPGSYAVAYQLCDTSTPANCATVTDTITVTGNIHPVADVGSAVAGTASTPIANVTANDTVDGAAATLGTGGTATVAQSGTWPAGIALNAATGAVSTSASVKPGAYSVVYQLCDRSTPANCATVADTITVSAAIAPAPDTGTAVAGVASTAIANVTTNDTVNGVAVSLGATGDATVSQSGSWPAGIALNTATGAITTTAAVQPGTYAVTYQLCDRNTPVNCATTTDSVTVAPSINPVADSGTAVAGVAATPVANVASNDWVNGKAAVLGAGGNATISANGTWPTGIALNTGTGAITTTAAVAPGTYALGYQLCDRLTPADCATVVDTVTVTANVHAVADTGTAVAGTATTAIANVTANDSINGATPVLGAGGTATIATVGSWPSGIALSTANGAVTTSAAVAPGTYSLPYQLCDTAAPTHCSTVTDTVIVSASIQPVAESGTAVAGTASTAIANVAANDWVNGVAAILGAGGNATVAQSGKWPAGIALNTATGAITIAATVLPGTYAVTYQLCDTVAPVACASATDTVTVSGSVQSVPESGTATAGTASTAIANVTANDIVNGVAAVLGANGNATISQSGAWPSGITLQPATGAIVTTAAVPPGTYSLPYQLCDRGSPPDCAIATDTVVVNTSIWPVADTGSAVAGVASTPIASVVANDLINGAAATLGSGGNATLAPMGSWPSGIVLDASTGAITTSAAVPVGVYPLTYQLCDRNSPPDCATTTATINVHVSVVANPAAGKSVAGVASTPVANVLATDTIGGAPATLGISGNAALSQTGTWPAGVALNLNTGAVTTSAAVPPGVYTVNYQLCDRASPPNCSTAVVTITVAATIVPASTSGTAVAGTAGTPIADIAALDTVNGQPATLGPNGNATIVPTGSWPAGMTLNTSTGTVSTAPSVPPGTYTITYRLCDRSTPPSCAQAEATVVLTVPTGGLLFISKSADRAQAQIGDSVQYRIQVRNTGAVYVTAVHLNDSLPAGFTLISGTTLLGRDGATPTSSANPQGAPGPALVWQLGGMAPGDVIELDYRVRVGVEAAQGTGINTAQAVGGNAVSQVATARVIVRGGAFGTDACVVGKIYVDCNGNRVQDPGEPGIPGVRVYLEDGTNLTSDENGNYSICGVRPITHALKVDLTTLPAGSRLVVLSSRNAGDGNSLFVDVRDGELHRADFAEGSCTDKVLQDVARRRQHGPVFAPLPPAGHEHKGVDFESVTGAEAGAGAGTSCNAAGQSSQNCGAQQ